MEGLFLQILNMSISASWLIAVVLVLRLLLQKVKVPKGLCYVLWAFVAVRLLCPISMESGFSLIPSGETFSKEVMYGENPEIHSGIESVDNAINSIIDSAVENGILDYENRNVSTGNENIAGDTPLLENGSVSNDQNVDTNGNGVGNTDSVVGNENSVGNMNVTIGMEDNENAMTRPDISGGANVLQELIRISAVLWGVGMIGMLVYTLISYIRLQYSVKASVHLRDKLWICDAIRSPFILGLFNPRIYLPSYIKEEQIPYIIAHENEHLKYRDHWWKPLGFGILAIHWFNPLVWVAYNCMCRDIELACDERVIRLMNNVEKKQYMESLLLCNSPRHLISACPVAFGEIGIKERIKNVVNYKKPATWIVGIGAVLCVMVAICFLTNPVGEKEDDGSTLIDNKYATVSVVYETTADITHDGIDDFVQVTTYKTNEDVKEEQLLVKVYQGLENGEYDVGTVFMENNAVEDEARKETLCLLEYEGKDYLLCMSIHEMLGKATYEYEVFYMTENKTEVVVEAESVTFACDPFAYAAWERLPHREAVVPEFRQRVELWTENAIVLFSQDETTLKSITDAECLASEYFDIVWARNEDALIAEFNEVAGSEEWMQLFYREDSTNRDNVLWITQELASDFSEWYTDYDGSTLQRVEEHDPWCQGSCGIAACCDTVYYKAGVNEDVQKVLYKMLEAMIIPRMEDSDFRPYTITEYAIEEQPVVQIAENMWLVEYLNGFYKFEGQDLGSFETLLKYENPNREDGLVAFERSGSSSVFWYLLMEENGVYRLQNFADMKSLKEDMRAETERILYQTNADLNHDGIQDYIQTIQLTKYAATPDKGIFIRVFEGLENGGYSAEKVYESSVCGISPDLNEQIILTERDGKDYIVYTYINENKETPGGEYSYDVIYLSSEVEVVEANSVAFAMDPYSSSWNINPHREDVVPGFAEKLQPWIENGIFLYCSDKETYISTAEQEYPASIYFNEVWSRVDVTDDMEIGFISYDDWKSKTWAEIVRRYPNHVDIQQIERGLNSRGFDPSDYFFAYNGEDVQIISDAESVAKTVTNRDEIVFYRTDETDVQKVLQEMLTCLIDPLMEEEAGRPYTITKYELDEVQPLKQINEHVWILDMISGYYAYEGIDMGTMEEVMDNEPVKDGMIPFLAQGSSSTFQYFLIKDGDVYRLEKASHFGYGIEY